MHTHEETLDDARNEKIARGVVNQSGIVRIHFLHIALTNFVQAHFEGCIARSDDIRDGD